MKKQRHVSVILYHSAPPNKDTNEEGTGHVGQNTASGSDGADGKKTTDKQNEKQNKDKGPLV